MEIKKVLIGTPMYGGKCYGEYTLSCLANQRDLSNNGIEVNYFFVTNESLITRGRNTIVEYFMKNDFTHLMFIDADIVFPTNAIRVLLDKNEDIVCAPYVKKHIFWDEIKKATYNIPPPEDYRYCGSSFVINLLPYSDNKPNDKGLVEVVHSGTGFMLISKKVFEKLKDKVKKARPAETGPYQNNWYSEYFTTSIDEAGVYQSEDWHFCNLWRSNGGKIYLLPDMVLSHIGTYRYQGNLMDHGPLIT